MESGSGGVEDALREFGVSEEAIARARERGDPVDAFFESLPVRAAIDRTVSPAQIEARGGPPPAQIAELMLGFGLPAPDPDDSAFSAAEAEALITLWASREVFPFDLAVRTARLYGRLLSRIAQSEMQNWFAVVEPRLRASATEERDRAALTASSFDGLMPVAEAMINGVHRRWVEHEAAQIVVRSVEARAAERLKGAVAAAILFCDLKDFTAYADLNGDVAAAEKVEQFANVVQRERGPQARLTKLLGDGFMLVYPEARPAVDAGLRIIAAMGRDDRPGVHASVHYGFAVPLEGDYFGAAVNVAARLLVLAECDELLATASVIEQCPELRWRSAGRRRLRGVSDEVEIYRLGGEDAGNGARAAYD
jgi:class 3 adenylate cyclase